MRDRLLTLGEIELIEKVFSYSKRLYFNNGSVSKHKRSPALLKLEFNVILMEVKFIMKLEESQSFD